MDAIDFMTQEVFTKAFEWLETNLERILDHSVDEIRMMIEQVNARS